MRPAPLTAQLGVGLTVAVSALCLSACGSGSGSALQLASSHPNSLAAANYVSIQIADLPAGYRSDPASRTTSTQDAAQTLAEFRCERLSPPSGPPPLSARTPNYTDATGTTEVHETTDIFGDPLQAASRLELERNPRYPSCKASAFRNALVATASSGEHVGFVKVQVTPLPRNYGDGGVEVQGVSTLTLPGGVAAVATSDLVVLVRGRIVAELSVETDGPEPRTLLNRLTSDLARRLAQVVPKA